MDTFKNDADTHFSGIEISCLHCKYSELEQIQGQVKRQLVCHHSPPAVVGVISQQGLQLISMFPLVQGHQFCHQFRSHLLSKNPDSDTAKPREVPNQASED